MPPDKPGEVALSQFRRHCCCWPELQGALALTEVGDLVAGRSLQKLVSRKKSSSPWLAAPTLKACYSPFCLGGSCSPSASSDSEVSREPKVNVSDNLLRDFEDRWWKCCTQVGMPVQLKDLVGERLQLPT